MTRSVIALVVNALALGVALSFDSFSLCVADALVEPLMARKKKALITFMHSAFQALMPALGYVLVRVVAGVLTFFLRLTPYISFFLLTFLGVKMIKEALHGEGESAPPVLGVGVLLSQGVAASIDALSVGFAIASYNVGEVLATALIIAAVTGVFCVVAFALGKTLSARFSKQAGVVAAIILIAIGLEILIQSFF